MGAPLVFAVKGNALDDGPGIRSVVFFKGCPLSCAWCHNPEGRRREAEISFDPSLCLACHACEMACPEKAILVPDDRSAPESLVARIDLKRCTVNGYCTEVCPSSALEVIGEPFDLDGLTAKILRDKPFFDASGGGVTLSGGEAAWFPEHAGALAARMQQEGIHVLLETSGVFDLEHFDAAIYPHLDLIWFDLKIADSTAHRKWCGVDNALIHEHFEVLHRRHVDGGVAFLPRIPLVPDITATEENLVAIAELLRGWGCDRVALLAYNPTWFDKAIRVGMEVDPALSRSFMGSDEVKRWARCFEEFEVVLG